MLSALLTEYANTSCSSRVGLTWEFHHKCKVAFEVCLTMFLLSLMSQSIFHY